jgi:predicted alpha/beta superfamily hydrolase
MKYLCLALLLSFTGIITIYAQVKSATPAFYVDSGIVIWNYHSKTINEDYTIYVNLPSGYDTTKISYPVLYLTDGDWNEITAMDCFSMLDQDYETIAPIIVGIGYGTRPNMRSRDLDPATGGPNFLAFIEQEIMPFIKSKYRANGDNALYGYSFGGEFTTSVLFDHPGLFNTVFIGAPGDSGRKLVPAAQKYFASYAGLKCKVFVGVGSYEVETVSNVNKFKTYLLKQHPKGLDFKTVIVANTAHGTAIAPVMQAAMKFAYCKTHAAIHLTAKQLQNYTGNYTFAPHPEIKFRFFVTNKTLYFQQPHNMPKPFVPFARDQFFTYENEKGEFTFKQKGKQKYVLYTANGQKPQRLDKVN